MALSNVEGNRGAFHESRARNYRRRAGLLLERDGELDAAAILLYESAKQCINAVANRKGENPRPTGAKVRFLRHMAERESSATDLPTLWRAADRLHIHADQGQLSTTAFMEAWGSAQLFIDQMLQIYARDQ